MWLSQKGAWKRSKTRTIFVKLMIIKDYNTFSL